MARLSIRAEEQKVLQDIKKKVYFKIHSLQQNFTQLILKNAGPEKTGGVEKERECFGRARCGLLICCSC